MKLNFKIFNLIAVTLLSMLSFSSCKDEDWEPLKWTVDNMNPEDIVVKSHPDYDPNELQQTVIANEKGGEIVFYCENYDDLYLTASGYNNNDNTFDNNIISVKVDGDKIIINFPKLDEIPEEGSWVILFVKTRNNKNPMTTFMIGRNADLNFLD